MVMPVAITFPTPPITMEVVVMDSTITWWHIKDIIRWNHNDWRRDEAYLDRGPGVAVRDGPKPMTPVMAIPIASMKIETHYAGDHINIVWSTGNYYKFWWC
jgi:hypothetical protein